MTEVAGPVGGAAPPTDITQTYPYTCNTCQVAFRGSEVQREHMRSDWQ